MRIAGRLVTVCLASSSSNVESLLRVDAKPFIAAHLKTLFNHRPQQFHSVQLQLAGLFNKRYSAIPLAAGQEYALNISYMCMRLLTLPTPDRLKVE